MSARWMVAAVLAVSGCAGPPLALYTLAPPPLGAAVAPLGTDPVVIAVARVSIPDALDSADIVVRDGNILRRSSKGRWASRLSLGITDLITARLAASRPDALVTDQPQAGPVSARLAIDISRLDVTASGAASLDADWTLVPTDPARPVLRDRATITGQGNVATDQGVAALMQDVVGRLGDAIGRALVRK
jgi:uncharacterized lipoprotein YmbA